MNTRERDRLKFVAGWSRLALAAFGLLLLPIVYPGLSALRAVFVGYLAVSIVGQLLIAKRIGGTARAIVSGSFDLAMITLIVHRVGSTATLFVSFYFVAVMFTSLIVGRRLGMLLSVLVAGTYFTLLGLEVAGVLPYAPDASVALATPTPSEAVVAGGVLALLLTGTAAVVSLLVERIDIRESELLDANRRLAELSQRDPLTQLFNRRHLIARLEDELRRFGRGHPLAVLMIDLDGFKRVNDERGHHQGDDVLAAIAEGLREATRAIDVPGRYGGDEFVVLLPDTGLEEAAAVGARLVDAVRAVGERFDSERPVTASVGLAIAREGLGARALIQLADQRAYKAKRAGGGRLVALADAEESE